MLEARFWETKSLEELSREEWEALCDGCGRCCCTVYQRRTLLVPDCIKVTPELARDKKCLPDTCAYRLLAEHKALFGWHPLISGDPDSIHQEDISVRDKVIPERYVHPDELPGHLMHWFD